MRFPWQRKTDPDYLCGPCSHELRIPMEPEYRPGETDREADIPECGRIALNAIGKCHGCGTFSSVLRRTRAKWLQDEAESARRASFYTGTEGNTK